ncbi:MAG: hypothetical protein WC780_06985 [Lentimicrobiaceae bacterium]|jgi:hypothetical protein
MARKNQLDSCFNTIENYFDLSDFKSFTAYKFNEIINKNRHDWGIPNSKSSKQVLSYLVNKQVLFENIFLDALNLSKAIYSWKTHDEFTIIAGLKSESYFTHYSAIYLHQLTLQIPKTIYLNFEHNSTLHSFEQSLLTQKAIDDAFKGSQRKSSSVYSFSGGKVILTNGMYTNKIGVLKKKNNEQYFEYTDIERTLIDISVRPVYAGGVFEVLEAFKLAKSNLDAKKMADYLLKMNFIYPYHQVIGFYLEKANYSEKDIAYFKKEMKFNFYLTYNIRNKEFSEKWRLYYPKGL